MSAAFSLLSLKRNERNKKTDTRMEREGGREREREKETKIEKINTFTKWHLLMIQRKVPHINKTLTSLL